MIYNNLIKVESTRVKLYPVRNNDPLSTYIHANYINGYNNNIEETTTTTRAFIATQGPMSNTLNDFWHLVWQESITYVVMITKLKENSKSQCDSYIPDENNIFVNYGEISVCVESIHYEQDYDIRKIILNVSFITLMFPFFYLILNFTISSLIMKHVLFIIIGIHHGQIKVHQRIQSL
jgi:receptor-type tyrosine-protein phosphatase R